MRKAIWPPALVAVGCALSFVTLRGLAQQRDAVPDEGPRARRAAGDAGPAGAIPPGMEIGAKLELFLMRPGRVVVRDTWRVGRLECEPWENGAPGAKGALRINAVLAHVQDKPDEKAAGLELILQDEFQDHTFMFDPEQVADFLVGLETVRAASETMRDPPQDVGRRAVFNLNGLELGMAPRRSGGYLAPVGPDEQPVGLNPDNFQELKRLLTEAQAVLKRESAAK
jgi:hypothetical protein